MVKTNAERQAAYRQKLRETGELERFCVLLDPEVKEQFLKLTRRKGSSHQETFERLVTNAYNTPMPVKNGRRGARASRRPNCIETK